MKEKMKIFSEDEWLSDLAFKREMRLWEIEGDKRDEYEKGSYQERLSNTILLFENLYPQESSNFLKECTFEELESIFHLLLQKASLEDIHTLLSQTNHKIDI